MYARSEPSGVNPGGGFSPVPWWHRQVESIFKSARPLLSVAVLVLALVVANYGVVEQARMLASWSVNGFAP
jgi:hypothetical protein